MREQGGDNIKVVKDNVKNYEDLPTVPIGIGIKG